MRPTPWPLGKDKRPQLISSNADGLHAANAHRGTVIRDCLFINTGLGPHLLRPSCPALSSQFCCAADWSSSGAGGTPGLGQNAMRLACSLIYRQ